jgi:hypothetical protein
VAAATSKGYAALAIACLALAVSVYTALRGREPAPAAAPAACVDQEARAQTDELRRLLVARDARIAQLAATAAAAGSPAGPAAGAAAAAAPPVAPGPRRYTHFEIPNPAVTVTQKEDGTYDIRTTDPALAGTVIEITAVTGSGEEDKMLIRIPQ